MGTLTSNLSERDERLGEIVFACLQAADQGQPLDHQEIVTLHPEFATELAEFFAELTELDGLTAPLREVARAAAIRKDVDQAATATAGESSSASWAGHETRYLDGYDLLEEIGQGGNGVVYKARHLGLNRVVALKMMSAGRLATSAERQRFQNEIKAVAELDHPHIVPIYEHGVHEGSPYFSMKLVGSGSLAQWIAARRTSTGPGLPPTAAARLLATVARAVHYAHQRGILHRDLKPANILLGSSPDSRDEAQSDPASCSEHELIGVPYLTDFSLSKRVQDDSTLTRSGDILGTPSYMAPEQAGGRTREITTATDVYGLGAVLYAMLTGRPPFQADTVLETLQQVNDCDPKPPGRINRRVDRDLETICLKCLEKHPERRYGSARELAEDLDRWLAGESIQARRAGMLERAGKWARRRPAIAGLSALVVIIAVAGLIGMFVLYGQAVIARTHAVARTQQVLAALQRSEASLYANRIALADRYRTAHDPDRADDLLEECPVTLRAWEWNYLKRRSLEDVLVHADGHGRVQSVAFSSDDHFLVAVDQSPMIRVRDLVSCRVLEVPGLPGQNRVVALSPDGQWMAVGGETGNQKAGSIKLWSTTTWSEVKTLPFVGDSPHALAFSPDSQRLAAGHDDDMVRVWEVATGTLRTLTGHKKVVKDVAFSPDGRLIASASWDMTIRIWDAETGTLRATLLHERPVVSLAFHPGGRLLASSTGDVVDSSRSELSIWDVRSARIVRKTSALASIVQKVCFSPDGHRLATAGWDKVVRIWDSASLEEMLSLTGHAGRVWCVAFSPDGNQLVSGADDGLRRWSGAPLPNRPRPQATRTIWAHEKPIYALGLTPDGHHLISGGEDYKAHVWDVETGRDLLTYHKHKFSIYAVAVRPDGLAVATGGDDQVIRLWDPRSGADLRQLRGHTGSISSLAFHPDGIRLASAGQDSTVRLWDTRTGAQLDEFTMHSGWMTAVVFSSDGNWLAAAGDDAEIRVWRMADRKLHILHGHTERIVTLAFHPNSLTLASSSLDGTVRIWQADVEGEQRRFDGVRGRGLAWSPDGRHFAASGAGGSLKVWEYHSGIRILTLQGHADDISSAVFSRDGRRIFTAGWDHTIKLWETSANGPDLWAGETQRLDGHPVRASAVAVLPDGKRAVSGGEERTIRLWDVAGGRELRSWAGSDFKVWKLSVTPDGKQVVVAGEYTDIRVYDIESARELRRFNRHEGAIFALAVTPDGRHVLTGGPLVATPRRWVSGSDLDLHLWDLNTGAEVRRLSGHRDGIWSVAISRNGRHAASTSMDGTIRVWDLGNGAELRRFATYPDAPNTVEFLPDGRRILSAGTDFHLRLWDIDTAGEVRRLDGPASAVNGLAIAPDGRRALSSGDHALRLWDLDTGRELYHYEVPHVVLTRGTFSIDGRQAIWPASDGLLRVWDLPETSSPQDGPHRSDLESSRRQAATRDRSSRSPLEIKDLLAHTMLRSVSLQRYSALVSRPELRIK